MKVSVDDLDVAMELGNNGILLAIYDNDGTYRGKLRVGKAKPLCALSAAEHWLSTA